MRSPEMTKPALASGPCSNISADRLNINQWGVYDMGNIDQKRTELQGAHDELISAMDCLAALDHKPAAPDVFHSDLRTFVGDAVQLFADGIPDQGPGGFWLYGRLVGDKRRILDGTPLPPVVEGFHRWRLPGVDGVARLRDRNAPSIVLSETTGVLLFVRRDNLKPRRLDGVAELMKAIGEACQ